MTTFFSSTYTETPLADPEYCRSLQIRTDVPADELTSRETEQLHVSRWEYDGYLLQEIIGKRLGINYGKELNVLWGGIGFGVGFTKQYFPFSQVPGRPGEFNAILQRDGKDRLIKLEFSHAGDLATLTDVAGDETGRPLIVRYRRNQEEKASPPPAA